MLKRLLITTLAVSLLAPTAVLASQGSGSSGDNNTQQDQRADRVDDGDEMDDDDNDDNNDNDNDQFIQTSTGSVKVENNVSLPSGSISLDEALAAAQASGKSIDKVEIETEDGIVVFSVRFVDDSRVDVSASNGQVVRRDSGQNQNNMNNNDADDFDNNNNDQDEDDNDDEDDNNSSGGNSGRH